MSMVAIVNKQQTEKVLAGVQLQAGEEMAVFVNSGSAHFFEPGVTGKNLNRTNELLHALI